MNNFQGHQKLRKMATKYWILKFTICMAVTQQIQAASVCNGKGTNACFFSQNVVRPRHTQHSKNPELAIRPVADTCWCSKTIIQPASLDKPYPTFKEPSPACGCHGIVLPPSHTIPQVNYPVRDNSSPADPISRSLAMQAGKAIQVPEAKLAYGFVRTPINSLPKLYISSIKEEDLYALTNDVITLKNPMVTKTKNLQEDNAGKYKPSRLTYKQLGYEPEDFPNPTLLQIPSVAVAAEAAAYLNDGIKNDGSACGFKPGHITKVPQHNQCSPTNCLMKPL